MALTESEGTKLETLERIPKSGFPIGYANIMRVTIDSNNNFLADVRRYYSKTERTESEDSIPGLIGVGAQIPEELKAQILGMIYPYLDLTINKQYLNNQRMIELKNTNLTDEERTAVNEKYDNEIASIELDLIGG